MAGLTVDGIHDLGGMEGFGPVDVASGAIQAQSWESRVFALVNSSFGAGIIGNIDHFRHAIERIDPRAYLLHGYYGRWLGALETLVLEGGHLDQAAIAEAVLRSGGDPDALVAARPAARPDRIGYPPAERNDARSLARAPLHEVGQQVRTLAHGHTGHTRLPRYARGCEGRIVAWHGGWVYPDSNAHGHGEDPQHLYTVQFTGESLWGEGAEPGLFVHLDLFEPYLLPMPKSGHGGN